MGFNNIEEMIAQYNVDLTRQNADIARENVDIARKDANFDRQNSDLARTETRINNLEHIVSQIQNRRLVNIPGASNVPNASNNI